MQLLGFLGLLFSLVNFWGNWIAYEWTCLFVSLAVYVVGSILCIEVTLEETKTVTLTVPDPLPEPPEEIIILDITPKTETGEEQKWNEKSDTVFACSVPAQKPVFFWLFFILKLLSTYQLT